MPTERKPEHRRVVLTKDGPALIEGPVELVTDDGAVIRSDRFVVALCQCRRSKNYPLCDTSHRKRRRCTDTPREDTRAGRAD
ncbi:CDGSH iron-sulfur domain-containing protein [Nocardia transvalensis]|uniref:CDGSH iron-sulfur domain-containing protein n=1 Tax=Nocardia transvalensis TaxID=37333 RepID=UPI00189510E4|nr:CDGSH iron-sulfur domain-containing protein [Nocardia transvalensis]MBF6329626.1 CDGSH iron-sulfur domain-containing protein [Nocardia transvalensis]